MPVPVTVPRLGWSMEEGTFVGWLKAEGDPVRAGDAVFQLEGEKGVEEVESFDAGTLHVPAGGPRPGDRVAVGAVIGFLLREGEAIPHAVRGDGGDSPSDRIIPPVERGQEAVPTGASRDEQSPAITPRARRLAKNQGVDCAGLRGSGRGGRVRERDVASHAPSPPPGRVVPHTPIRRAIATRMVESLRTAAPVTLTSAVDATNLANLRQQFKAAGGPVPSYTDLVVKLAAVALEQHPRMTARWTDAGLVLADRIDVGIAVDTDAGLLVPVVRGVPALGLSAVAARTRDLIDRARRGTLPAADLRGGCFTVTNLGAFGVDAFTPIINPPESAVLGVGRIERRPVMDGDRVVGREIVTLSLTFDHRVADGAPTARFLRALASCIENPAPWLTG